MYCLSTASGSGHLHPAAHLAHHGEFTGFGFFFLSSVPGPLQFLPDDGAQLIFRYRIFSGFLYSELLQGIADLVAADIELLPPSFFPTIPVLLVFSLLQ